MTSQRNTTEFLQSDGGRAAAGFRGNSRRDAVIQAVAAHNNNNYRACWDSARAHNEAHSTDRSFWSPRRGVVRREAYLDSHGFSLVLTDWREHNENVCDQESWTIDEAAAKHPNSILAIRPSRGSWRSYVAVVDGVYHDDWDRRHDSRFEGVWVDEIWTTDDNTAGRNAFDIDTPVRANTRHVATFRKDTTLEEFSFQLWSVGESREDMRLIGPVCSGEGATAHKLMSIVLERQYGSNESTYFGEGFGYGLELRARASQLLLDTFGTREVGPEIF